MSCEQATVKKQVMKKLVGTLDMPIKITRKPVKSVESRQEAIAAEGPERERALEREGRMVELVHFGRGEGKAREPGGSEDIEDKAEEAADRLEEVVDEQAVVGNQCQDKLEMSARKSSPVLQCQRVNLAWGSAWRHSGQDERSLRLQDDVQHRGGQAGTGHHFSGGELGGGLGGWDQGAMKAEVFYEMSLLENRMNETFKMWMKVRQVKVAFLVEEDSVMIEEGILFLFHSSSTRSDGGMYHAVAAAVYLVDQVESKKEEHITCHVVFKVATHLFLRQAATHVG